MLPNCPLDKRHHGKYRMTDTPLKIMHVASGDLWAGAEVQLYMLARAQRQQGAFVTAILLNNGTLATKLASEGIPVNILPEAEFSSLEILRKLVSLVRTEAPDIVHTHRFKENLLGGLAAWINRIPSVRTQHGAREFTYSWQDMHKCLLHTMERLVGRYIQARVVAVSQELAGKLRVDFSDSHITVIENGIDPDAFTHLAPHECLPPTLIQAKRRVGIVGRLVPVKRVDIFIAAAAQIIIDPALQDVEFFIIGDGPLRSALEHQASPMSGRIHFLGATDTVHPYIQALDVLVMCSDHEGLPMTLLEAMALGIPVVGHSVGGIAQLLSAGQNGWPVNTHESSAYAAKIIEALIDGPDRAQRIDNARLIVREKFSAPHCATLHIAMYNEILKSH